MMLLTAVMVLLALSVSIILQRAFAILGREQLTVAIKQHEINATAAGPHSG